MNIARSVVEIRATLRSVTMRLPRVRTVLLVGIGLLTLWGISVAWILGEAAQAVRSGRSELTGLGERTDPATLLDQETDRRLAAAEGHFAEARSRLRNPLVAPLRVVPVVGRHVRAADSVVSAAQGTTRVARGVVGGLRELSERDLDGGPGRVRLLSDLADLAAGAKVELEEIDPGSGEGLFAPLGEAADSVRTERDRALDGVIQTERTARAVAGLLDGPGDHLLIGANNAEMRAGSGMYLSAAPLAFDDGSMTLGDVRPTASLVLPEGQVPVDGDLADNWPWLDPGRDLRTLGLSVDFPQSAEVASRFWAEVPDGTEVEGVILVDVEALRHLLAVVGPVEVDGVRYTTETVNEELLHTQYVRAGDGADDVAARRDRLGDVAAVVFDRVERGEWELDAMITALVDVVQGRHLMVWSRDPDVQEVWTQVGVDGRLRENSLSVTMLNRGAQKLDAHMRTEVDLRTSGGGGATGRTVDITYRIANQAPAEGPRYQIGPNVAGLEAGDHRGIVVVNLPAGTTDVELEGARLTLRGSDGPTVVVAGELDLGRGETTEVKVRAVLAPGVAELVIEPSGRIPPTTWTIDGEWSDQDRRRTVTLGG